MKVPLIVVLTVVVGFAAGFMSYRLGQWDGEFGIVTAIFNTCADGDSCTLQTSYIGTMKVIEIDDTVVYCFYDGAGDNDECE